MPDPVRTEQQLLQGLARAMRQHESRQSPDPARTPATDEHILRALLGKSLKGPTPIQAEVQTTGSPARH